MWRYMRDLDQIKPSINVRKEKKKISQRVVFHWDFVHNSLYICTNIKAGLRYQKTKVLNEVGPRCLIKTNLKMGHCENMANIRSRNRFDCAHVYDIIGLLPGEQG